MSFLCHYVILKVSDKYLFINKIEQRTCHMSLENENIYNRKRKSTKERIKIIAKV